MSGLFDMNEYRTQTFVDELLGRKGKMIDLEERTRKQVDIEKKKWENRKTWDFTKFVKADWKWCGCMA